MRRLCWYLIKREESSSRRRSMRVNWRNYAYGAIISKFALSLFCVTVQCYRIAIRWVVLNSDPWKISFHFVWIISVTSLSVQSVLIFGSSSLYRVPFRYRNKLGENSNLAILMWTSSKNWSAHGRTVGNRTYAVKLKSFPDLIFFSLGNIVKAADLLHSQLLKAPWWPSYGAFISFY